MFLRSASLIETISEFGLLLSVVVAFYHVPVRDLRVRDPFFLSGIFGNNASTVSRSDSLSTWI